MRVLALYALVSCLCACVSTAVQVHKANLMPFVVITCTPVTTMDQLTRFCVTTCAPGQLERIRIWTDGTRECFCGADTHEERIMQPTSPGNP